MANGPRKPSIMRPPLWHPPVELSASEQSVVCRIQRAKLFIFLRKRRQEIFTDGFQDDLGSIFPDSPKGQPPVAPAQLALATILQAYIGASDDEAIEASVMDRRWQLVLDCLDCEVAPFSKATLVGFRKLLIERELDRRLIERTVEIAERTSEFGSRQLRGALDSSPLWGAGRVEDTYNLLGHALRKALGVIARQQGRGLVEVALEAGASIVGGSSLKAALDLDWDNPADKQRGLAIVLGAVESARDWLHRSGIADDPTVKEGLATAEQVETQDVETGGGGA